MKLTSLFQDMFRLIESALEDTAVVEVGDRLETPVGVEAAIAPEPVTSSDAAAPLPPTAATPLGKREQIGTAYSTVLTGDGGEDALFSGEGRFSSLYGGGGDDFLQGNGGNDWLYGEGGMTPYWVAGGLIIFTAVSAMISSMAAPATTGSRAALGQMSLYYVPVRAQS